MMAIDLSAWQNDDDLTLQDAAYLWAGLPPNLLISVVRSKYPEAGAIATKVLSQLTDAAKNKTLVVARPVVTKLNNPPQQPGARWQANPEWSGEFVPPIHGARKSTSDQARWSRAVVSRSELRRYADSVGARPAFLFPGDGGEAVPPYLDRNHPCFSEELEAAILAWKYASERHEGSKMKPKGLIEEWLQANPTGLSAEAKKRIATLSNWVKTTGPKATT